MSDHAGALSESLASLSHFFVGEATLQETLQRVADLACKTIPGADMVGITMLVGGRPATPVVTDEAAVKIDATQYETGIGPCLDAFHHRQVLRLDSTNEDDRWPPFSEAAARHGVASVLSLPLVANHEGVGALNVYAHEEAAFSDEAERVGSAFATQASIVLANAQAYWDAYQLSQNLSEAMKSRATIEQAKGILMAARRCGAEEAFQILVRASQRENRKLREVAEQIVWNTEKRNIAKTDGRSGSGAATAGP